VLIIAYHPPFVQRFLKSSGLFSNKTKPPLERLLEKSEG